MQYMSGNNASSDDDPTEESCHVEGTVASVRAPAVKVMKAVPIKKAMQVQQ
jgi:hypothetical protein